ncbi:hypothetical protein JG687_00018417 [Phytophthora cactorum]|uniref:Uncharacterized protein n=1 Tax=Phytophthora cactorum TaxID=29920 RepID=A0A8T1TPW3_9STRA|nr:hypothetical protein JG687_00018417 [Phytophthora cactorum]
MKRTKAGCTLFDVVEQSSCCICGRSVHHICSNELCGDEELSKRLVSNLRVCVCTYPNEGEELEQSSHFNSQGMSASSQATDVSLASLTNDSIPSEQASTHQQIGIPDSITHSRGPRARDDMWDMIHVLDAPVNIHEKQYTHICTICAKTEPRKRALC